MPMMMCWTDPYDEGIHGWKGHEFSGEERKEQECGRGDDHDLPSSFASPPSRPGVDEATGEGPAWRTSVVDRAEGEDNSHAKVAKRFATS